MARSARDQSASTRRTTSATRRASRIGTALGLLVTIIVAVATAFGSVEPLERILLDLRFRWCAFFNPPPSDRILHIDIDDNSLAKIGRWPWPRAHLATVVRELTDAGARVIAFDVLFHIPQPARYEPVTGGAEPAQEDEPLALLSGRSVARIDDDHRFARAIADSPCVLLPINLQRPTEDQQVGNEILDYLRDHLDASPEQIIASLELDEDEAEQVRQRLASLKARTIRQVLMKWLSGENPPTLAECRRRLLPEVSQQVSRTPEAALLAAEYDRVRSVITLSRQLPLAPADEPRLFNNIDVPIAPLAKAATNTGFVWYESDSDGRLRSVPMWLAFEDRLYPHFALAMACELLEVPISELRVSDDQTIIPPGESSAGLAGEIHLPTPRSLWTGDWLAERHRLIVSWPSNATHWQNLFDPEGPPGAQHFPIGPIVEITQLRRDTLGNQFQADRALLALSSRLGGMFSSDLLEEYDRLIEPVRVVLAMPAGNLVGHADIQAWQQQRDGLRKQILDSVNFARAGLAGTDSLNESEQQLLMTIDEHLATYELALAEAEAGREQIDRFRARLREMAGGRVCLIGWTATGSIADFVPTSLYAKCPGVVVLGAVLNSILTDHLISRAPIWVDVLLILIAGTLVTWVANRFAAVTALLLTGLMGAVYLLFNGFVLFDWANLAVAAASPLLVAVLAWASVTVVRLVIEQRERLRITRQFKNYVSPDLVDYLAQHPDLLQMEGQTRQLTCLFSDIAGFTTVSQQLGPEQTAKLLNRYLGIATEQLMAHRAMVNKYLGDGIMAFWGAPIENPRHPLDACESTLACLGALQKLNDEPMLQGLPQLFMRVGISTGEMMVGDFGAPPQRSDYTVIGDAVNLASRLEQANKQFDTQVLLSKRTYEMVADHILARPIGRIVVVGRQTPEPVYELLTDRKSATEHQCELVECTAAVVEAYYAAEFERCLKLLENLVDMAGATGLTDRYAQACREHLGAGTTAEQHDGSIVLSEK